MNAQKGDFASDTLVIRLSWPNSPGGLWERTTLPTIRRTIRSFTPVTSNTERKEEERSLSIPRRRLAGPMIVDDVHDPCTREQAPNVLMHLNLALCWPMSSGGRLRRD